MTLAEYKQKRGEPLPTDLEFHAHTGEGSRHPSALEYIAVGLFLAVVTAIEVALYYIDIDHTLLVVLLVIFSLVKFATVVLWFMHLKFDSRLYRIFFLTGLLGALTVFTIVIAVEGGHLV
jgi:cytochrome c oxidase subunit 4